MKSFITAVGLACALAAGAANAQYPEGTVRLVVPYPAGGGVDFVGRTLGQRLGALWGQAVTVDNRSGASGSIGADAVAKAKPDGLTLLLASPAEVLVGPIAGQKTPYDADKAFTPVILAGETPLGIVAHPSVSAANLGELIAAGRKGGSADLGYGTPGAGSTMHFAGEALAQMSGMRMTHIPYRGAAPAVNDLLGNQVPLGIVGLPPVVPHAKAGKLKLLAVTTGKRSSAFPNVPAVSELPGMENYRFSNWMLLLAPAGTPAAVVDKIAADVGRVLQDPEIRRKLEEAGVAPEGLHGAALAKFLQDERVRYSTVAKARNVRFSD